MRDPFRIDGPAMISFSGGRTSGLMLRRILDAHGGTLPEDVHVLFANTGKEREETLTFVDRVAREWAVPIHWIEYRKNSDLVRAPGAKRAVRTERDGPGFVEVTFATASRNGEPFLALLAEREYLPNPVTRFCTTEMKYMRSRGLVDDEWTNVVGMRADEPRRVAKMRRRDVEGAVAVAMPLADAGVTQGDVFAFWAAQSFDLALRPWEGNCDLCFLKGMAKIERIMRDRPDLAEWWMEREREIRGVAAPGAALFRYDRPRLSVLYERSQRPMLPGMEAAVCAVDDLDTCACTD